jgi:hypothetical protein
MDDFLYDEAIVTIRVNDIETSTGHPGSDFRFEIHPNPTNHQLTIETSQVGQHFIEITSLNGQLLYSNRMEGSTHQIDLSFFEKGVYFISIKFSDYVRTEKIIKQ